MTDENEPGRLSSAIVRARFPWLPPAHNVWQVQAGEHWDAVRVPRSIGLAALRQLGDASGAVIQDPWSRILYWLVRPGTTVAWDVPETMACGETTYVAVPSLNAARNGLHWMIPPAVARCLTDTRALRAALQTEVGPRPALQLDVPQLGADR